MRLKQALTLIALIFIIPNAANAIGKAENVLVVQNGNSPVSCRIAAYYILRRGIPRDNLVTINTQDSSTSQSNELITPENYSSLIEQPIKDYISAKGLSDKIQYIVLTKGIPHRLTADPTGGTSGAQSVDSILASVDLVNPLAVQFEDENKAVIATVIANRYWRAKEPFTHSKYGGYLVTRLDGYTESDAKALVDRALAPQTTPLHILFDTSPSKGMGDPSIQPISLLNSDGSFNQNYQLHYYDFNADMTRAYQIISSRPHISAELEQTTTFMSSPYALSGYVSWGSNDDSSFTLDIYHSLAFAPASAVETAVSTSGRTLLPATGGQSLIADLIAQGASGAKGYATEPYLDAMASPTVFYDVYTSGRNLAEAYYSASRFLAWKDVVLGDPLCALSGNVVTSISVAKSSPDGLLISLDNQVVTAGTDDFGDRFYIESADRTSAIQVRIGKEFSGVTRGSTISVRGILATIDGERVITNASVVY